MKRSRWAFLLLAATVGLFGQRADAMRTPLADIRAAITQPQQLTAPSADAATPAAAPNQVRDASTWLVESIIPLGRADDGDHIELVTFRVPLSSLAGQSPASTRAGPYADQETHTRVLYIVQSPLGLAPGDWWDPRSYATVHRQLWGDFASGAARDQAGAAILSYGKMLVGVGQVIIGGKATVGSGGLLTVGGYALAASGASRTAGGLTDYANIFTGGSLESGDAVETGFVAMLGERHGPTVRNINDVVLSAGLSSLLIAQREAAIAAETAALRRQMAAERAAANRTPDIVYRRLHPAERSTAASQGLNPRSAAGNITPEQHILGARNSQYISTTRDYDAALSYNRNATPIVEIDLSRIPGRQVDFTNPSTLNALRDPQAIYHATKDAEVLIQGHIPAEAIGRIHYP